MSRSRYRIYEVTQPHFVTCTIVGWLPVFTRPATVNIIFDSWHYLREHDNFLLLGYVILEKPFAHDCRGTRSPGRDPAVQIVYRTAYHRSPEGSRGRNATLAAAFVRPYKTESDYQVWQEGSMPKQIVGDEMMLQKLECMHLNPQKRGYVDDPVHWRYSSARNYAGRTGLIEVVTDWR